MLGEFRSTCVRAETGALLCVCVFLHASFYLPREVLASRRVLVRVPRPPQEALRLSPCAFSPAQVCRALRTPQMWEWV